tara:strand:- start:851 stop:1012 length:162 start_codon:yes stop_codon:yes gene_type:complete
MTDKEKLKEIKRICGSWKAIRAVSDTSKKVEAEKALSFIEKQADEILNIIKEK